RKPQRVTACEDAGLAPCICRANGNRQRVVDSSGAGILEGNPCQEFNLVRLGKALFILLERSRRRRAEIAVGPPEFLAVDRIIERLDELPWARTIVQIGRGVLCKSRRVMR